MSLLFAAIGATVTALVEVTLGQYIVVGDATPHPVLVGGVIWTIAAGIDRGITWAFVGGLVLDSLLGRPLGASSFALLVAVGGAALMAAVRQTGTINDPVALFVPGVLYDGILGMFLGPLVVLVHDRRTGTERVDW